MILLSYYIHTQNESIGHDTVQCTCTTMYYFGRKQQIRFKLNKFEFGGLKIED